ncbi:MAG: hypothetical protein IPL79_01150 [Myxococcales bacterium]|nr:hypothetical protein [Myxococcales bacterium]
MPPKPRPAALRYLKIEQGAGAPRLPAGVKPGKWNAKPFTKRSDAPAGLENGESLSLFDQRPMVARLFLSVFKPSANDKVGFRYSKYFRSAYGRGVKTEGVMVAGHISLRDSLVRTPRINGYIQEDYAADGTLAEVSTGIRRNSEIRPQVQAVSRTVLRVNGVLRIKSQLTKEIPGGRIAYIKSEDQHGGKADWRFDIYVRSADPVMTIVRDQAGKLTIGDQLVGAGSESAKTIKAELPPMLAKMKGLTAKDRKQIMASLNAM